MTDTNQLPPHTITIRDHPEPRIMQWSDLELAAIKKYAECYALQARAQVRGEPVTVAVDHFDNGPFEAYTNRIYPHVEIGTKLYTPPQPAQATQAEVTDEREAFESCALMEGSLFKRRADDPDKYWDGNVQDDWELWQAALSQRPAAVPMTPASRDVIMATRTANADADEWPEPWAYQRGWNDAEAHHGITAQAKKEAP